MLTSILLQVVTSPDTLASVAAVSAPVTEPEAITTETLSVLQLLNSGGWYIMIPLYILSVAAVYIFIERVFAMRKANKEDPNFMNQIKDFIVNGKIDAAKSLCAATDNPYARMIEKGMLRIGKPLSDISAAIENVGKLEVYKLEKGLAILATIAGAAPMIGFLGTVIGMIQTFHSMYAAGNSVEISQLAGGIFQALVTTVAGLVIGIIAFIGYNILVARVEKIINKMEATVIEFIDILHEPA